MPIVFIAYDYQIRGTLVDNLHAVEKRPPPDCTIWWPGTPSGRTQGDIWLHVVKHRIEECDHLLAFVDLPNANVGFEIGYGLGRGKRVALAITTDPPPGETRPVWLQRPPLNGLLIAVLETFNEIRAEVSASARWNQLPPPLATGRGVLLLCPERAGAAYLAEMPDDWGWQSVDSEGWGLYDLPAKLEGIGLVVWVVTPHTKL